MNKRLTSSTLTSAGQKKRKVVAPKKQKKVSSVENSGI
jgi:hypothetical protein